MALSDIQIRKAQPTTSPKKLFDGGGLFLSVTPAGGKLWRLKYRFNGKEKLFSIGKYPDVSLATARQKRDAARELLAKKIDPGEYKKVAVNMQIGLAKNTFESVGREWFAKNSPGLAKVTQTKHLSYLEKDVFPLIGHRPINELLAPDLLKVVKHIEGRGAIDVARRMHNICGRIFRYAVAHQKANRDPSRDVELNDILPIVKTKHHASITEPVAVGELLRALDGFSGSFKTRCALRVAPLLFVRPGELRHAEWSEIDFEKSEWRIPGPKMKMKVKHIVPLSNQAAAILKEIQPVTGSGRYVFPSERTSERPMSENTINASLRRLGYTADEMTGHGFRSTASTLLHELGLPHAVIERQLAHGERNKVSAAYNFAEHLPERRLMMQRWADYLDFLKCTPTK